jgi:hypothetical protein
MKLGEQIVELALVVGVLLVVIIILGTNQTLKAQGI